MTLEQTTLDSEDDVMEYEVLDSTGHTTHTWKRKNASSVTEARLLYDTLTKAGYLAARMTRSKTQGEMMTEFDPSAGRVMFIPPCAGG
jgi:hypothetical protein